MKRPHKWQLMSVLVIFRIALITSFRSEREISPDQIIRDSEGILTEQENPDIFQPVSLDFSIALL